MSYVDKMLKILFDRYDKINNQKIKCLFGQADKEISELHQKIAELKAHIKKVEWVDSSDEWDEWHRKTNEILNIKPEGDEDTTGLCTVREYVACMLENASNPLYISEMAFKLNGKQINLITAITHIDGVSYVDIKIEGDE